jgi:hypothetical protein
MEDKPWVHFRPTTLPPNPNTVTSPLRPASIPRGTSASLKQDIMINNTLTPKSHYTTTQYDFDLEFYGGQQTQSTITTPSYPVALLKPPNRVPKGNEMMTKVTAVEPIGYGTDHKRVAKTAWRRRVANRRRHHSDSHRTVDAVLTTHLAIHK